MNRRELLERSVAVGVGGVGGALAAQVFVEPTARTEGPFWLIDEPGTEWSPGCRIVKHGFVLSFAYGFPPELVPRPKDILHLLSKASGGLSWTVALWQRFVDDTAHMRFRHVEVVPEGKEPRAASVLKALGIPRVEEGAQYPTIDIASLMEQLR